jgi:hypothetical protein
LAEIEGRRMETLSSLFWIVFFGLFPIATGIFIVYTALMLNAGVWTWCYFWLWIGIYYSFLEYYILIERKKRPDL